MLTKNDLRDYQHRAIAVGAKRQRYALFVDMGLGKTAITLTTLVNWLNRFESRRILIIAPLRVAQTVWHVEAKNWEHTPGLRFSLVLGSEKERKAALETDADIYVVNVDNLAWLSDQYKPKAWPFDTVVIDESSTFKSWAAKTRFKIMRKRLSHYNNMVLLSGTPSPNTLLDLWAQIFLLDGGERLGRTITSFKKTYFDSDYMGYKFVPKPGADKAIQNKIKDICFSLRAEDYLQLPDRIINKVYVDVDDKTRAHYRELEKELLIELGDATVTAATAAVLSNKLLQFCNGTLYYQERNTRKQIQVHDAKVRALEEIIDGHNGPILIAYQYQSDLAVLRTKFKDLTVLNEQKDIEKTVSDWNAGKISKLAAHPASAGHGLNLQKGGHVAVWFGLSWSLEQYAQFNARLHRSGQTKPVIIHHIMLRNSIDDLVFERIAMKDAVQSDLLTALKTGLQR